jgi:hypothetical protein
VNLLHPDLATAIALAVSVVIPALAALLAKSRCPRNVAGLLTLALASLNGVLTEALGTGRDFDWRHAIPVAVLSYVVAVLAHYGLLKGTPAEANLLAVGNKPPMPVSGAR